MQILLSVLQRASCGTYTGRSKSILLLYIYFRWGNTFPHFETLPCEKNNREPNEADRVYLELVFTLRRAIRPCSCCTCNPVSTIGYNHGSSGAPGPHKSVKQWSKTYTKSPKSHYLLHTVVVQVRLA